jgi:hypothetical protein
MKTRDVAWLRGKLAYVLSFDSEEANQDFAGPEGDTWGHLHDFLTQAYEEEVTEAKLEVGVDPFVEVAICGSSQRHLARESSELGVVR